MPNLQDCDEHYDKQYQIDENDMTFAEPTTSPAFVP